MSKNKFHPGHVVVTSAAKAVRNSRIVTCLLAHLQGDWGLMPPEDKMTNDEQLARQGRVQSSWAIDPEKPSNGYDDNAFWIITDAPGTTTTVLLPSDY